MGTRYKRKASSSLSKPLLQPACLVVKSDFAPKPPTNHLDNSITWCCTVVKYAYRVETLPLVKTS